MANTIDGMNTGGAAIGAGGAVRPTAENPTHEPPAPQPGSDVQITDSAAQLAKLEETLRALPAIDQARVDAVSQALAGGRYAIDASRIAAGLLGSEHTLDALPRKEL